MSQGRLNAGTYAITAEYEGDSDSAASASSVLHQVVNPASTTTVITSSASTLGQNVTFTATVTSSTGAHASGTVATFATAALPVASLEITATYNGATDFTRSSDSPIQSVTP